MRPCGENSPVIIFGAILIFMMRQAQGTNSQAMSFGRSRARMFTGQKPTVTFVDVAGQEEAECRRLVVTALIEPVPRSILMAELVTRMPQDMTLLTVRSDTPVDVLLLDYLRRLPYERSARRLKFS